MKKCQREDRSGRDSLLSHYIRQRMLSGRPLLYCISDVTYWSRGTCWCLVYVHTPSAGAARAQNNALREANKQAAAGGRRNSPNYTTRAPSINLLELSRRIIAPVDLLSLDSRARDSLQIICTKSGKIVGVLAAKSVSALAREREKDARGLTQ
jgi:hypothetical protein